MNSWWIVSLFDLPPFDLPALDFASFGWERLAADALWQSTAIAGGAWIAARFVRRRPAWRAALFLAAATLSLTVPLLSSAVRSSGGGLLNPPAATALTPPVAVNRVELPYGGGTTFDSDARVELPFSAKPNSHAQDRGTRPWSWLIGCWLAASGYLLFRLLRGVLVLRRSVRLATECHDATIEAALSQAAAAVGVSPPPLLRSSAFASPALVVLGRATLLLPADMPDGVDWFSVFCHELAHLARRDNLGRLVMELAVITLPWQPLLWLLRRDFRTASEEACDDWAVAAGADPVEFASLLVALVPEQRPTFALGMAESPAATRHRILRLLAMQGPVHPRVGRIVGIVGWVAAIGLAVAVALLQSGRGPRLSDPLPISALEKSDISSKATQSPHDPAGPRIAAPPWGKMPLAEAITKADQALLKTTGPPASYVIEPPDVLLIDAVKLVPKAPYHLEPLDVLAIKVANPLIDQPIDGKFTIDPSGTINLGPAYGEMRVGGLTLGEASSSIEAHLKQVLRDPQISVTLDQTSGQQQIAGEHLVGPDGTVNLGTYGTVYVTGRTIEQAKQVIQGHLSEYLEQPRVSIDVHAYNSKVYYLIVEGGDNGDWIIRTPITGNDNVLDVVAQLASQKGIRFANCWAWISRPMPGKDAHELILPIDLEGVLSGNVPSNWRVEPGDRIFMRPRVIATGSGEHPILGKSFSDENPGMGAGMGGGMDGGVGGMGGGAF